MLNLPWKTHCAYLPQILKYDSAEVSSEKRICRHIFNGANSSNVLVSNVFMQGIIERKGLIGENVKYLIAKYGIPEQSFITDLHDSLLRIDKCNKPSSEVQLVVSQIAELLTCNVPLFDKEEINCIINDLCTQ